MVNKNDMEFAARNLQARLLGQETAAADDERAKAIQSQMTAGEREQMVDLLKPKGGQDHAFEVTVVKSDEKGQQ